MKGRVRRFIDRLPWRCQFYSDQWGRQCDKPRGHTGAHGAY